MAKRLARWTLLASTAGASTAAALGAELTTIRRPEFSFRGPIRSDGVIPNWDQAGHASRIPSAEDFVRVVPSIPLAYGSLFTEQPLPFDHWTAEVAFRIHGATAAGGSETKEPGKGGRGLAFWYTKSGLPTPAVIPSTPLGKDSPHSGPPPLTPRHKDPTDPSVSFFGSRAPFEGLGVVFDTQPSTPVTPRSAREFWPAHEGGGGASPVGVVAGVMDDGRTPNWVVTKSKSSMKTGEEAGYLGHTIGDCEAAFRNAPGLVWAKISHHGGNISVDLDLSPHTSLALVDRHYSHRCFETENIALPKGYFFGVTALASPNDEPDSVDVYAIDIREVVTADDHIKEAEEDRAAEQKEAAKHITETPLQGTTGSGEASLTFEIFNSQARIVESITELSHRVEELSKRQLPSGGSASSSDVAPELGKRLEDLASRLGTNQPDLADLKATIGKVLDRLTTAESRLSLIQTSLQGQLSTTTQRADEIMAQLRALPSEAAERAAAAGRRTFATTVKYILGAVVVLGGLVVAFSYFRAKGGKYARDEGSFANGSHARGQSFSLAMGQVGNSMGFRQRGGPGKKMI